MPPAYLHSLPGRLRLRLPEWRGRPSAIAAVGTALRSLPVRVESAPLTGSITFHYDPARLTEAALLAALREAGVTLPATAGGPVAAMAATLLEQAGRLVVGAALERSAALLLASLI